MATEPEHAFQDAGAGMLGEVVLLADAGALVGRVEGEKGGVDADAGGFVQRDVREKERQGGGVGDRARAGDGVVDEGVGRGLLGRGEGWGVEVHGVED